MQAVLHPLQQSDAMVPPFPEEQQSFARLIASCISIWQNIRAATKFVMLFTLGDSADPDFNQKLESVLNSLQASGIGSSSGSVPAPAPLSVPVPKQQAQAGSSTQGSRREQISSPNKHPPPRQGFLQELSNKMR